VSEAMLQIARKLWLRTSKFDVSNTKNGIQNSSVGQPMPLSVPRADS